MILITTPKDMLSNIKEFVTAIEKNFEESPKNMSSYLISFNGSLAFVICQEIKSIYTEAGWKVEYFFSNAQDGQTIFKFIH